MKAMKVLKNYDVNVKGKGEVFYMVRKHQHPISTATGCVVNY